jgi:hypothetical protein
VSGCDRHARLFHMKNLVTHAAPRAGAPRDPNRDALPRHAAPTLQCPPRAPHA